MGRLPVGVIKRGDYKLSAPEIEAVLLEHSNIREWAVDGLTDDIWGDRLVQSTGLEPLLRLNASLAIFICSQVHQCSGCLRQNQHTPDFIHELLRRIIDESGPSDTLSTQHPPKDGDQSVHQWPDKSSSAKSSAPAPMLARG
jgi:acyl-CoA synthetase (AMP-forming)/AMP-acid ligase II